MEILAPHMGDFVGTSEVARLLEQSEASIRAGERDGRLPKARRAGNRRFWSRAEILTFIEEKAKHEDSDR